ncbi:MAG TPA: hypothetical protein VED43_10480 [Mycobacterium sp.]|nr:hypothetical protein [Mycobacterium sp.]
MSKTSLVAGEPRPDIRPFLTPVHALRQIERAVVTAATGLGGHASVQVPSTVAT